MAEGQSSKDCSEGDYIWLVTGRSDVPQASIGGPLLFNVLISSLDAGVESSIIKFADDTNLGGAVESLEQEEAFADGSR